MTYPIGPSSRPEERPGFCPRCDGTGEVVLAPRCGHSGACPCDGKVIVCPDCEGNPEPVEAEPVPGRTHRDRLADGGDQGGMAAGPRGQQYAKPSSKSRTESDRVRA